MKLIVGLGNPGEKYKHTRHNCGFMVIDRISEATGIALNRKGFSGVYGLGRYHDKEIMLLKPMTYMNLSGNSISAAMHYYHLTADDLLVIYDDLDIAIGRIRLRQTGSAGGHNGMKHIINCLHTKNFERIRVGIGRDQNVLILDYVLKIIPKAERPDIEKAFLDARDACLMSLDEGFAKAMNRYNAGVSS